MDKQKCAICEKEFDFEKEGLGCGEIIVCGPECARKSASGRGNAYAIHDKSSGKIIDTNADGTEQTHNF